MMRSLTKTKVKLQALEDKLYSCSADLVETCKGGAMQRHNDVRHSSRGLLSVFLLNLFKFMYLLFIFTWSHFYFLS